MGKATGRSLEHGDLGKVFRRIDANGDPGEYLYLNSMGGLPPPIPSFITFRLVGGVAQQIADMGYFNGPWYQEQTGFSETFLAGLRQDYERFVAERLRSLQAETALERQHQSGLRARYAKPQSWFVLDEEALTGPGGWAYLLWYAPDALASGLYVLEIYGPGDRLLASGSLPCTHEPEFGIAAADDEKIFAAGGLLEQLLKQAEKA
ncbi:MAG: hypothetical protein ACAI44_17315 [Candidatus Sericytochromatia bacterium]